MSALQLIRRFFFCMSFADYETTTNKNLDFFIMGVSNCFLEFLESGKVK
jgi:hypothetical protein